MNKILEFFLKPDCVVYVACRMTGRDKAEMVQRAKYVTEIFAERGVKVISPVLEESVKNEPGKLVNHDKERLHGFWRRDKQIIRRESHVVMLDHGEMKSFGMEREYCLNRGVLWKPTVMCIPQGTPLSVAQFEDDAIFYSVHAAAAFIADNWGNRWLRWKWRANMLRRSLPRWIVDQVYAWR